MAGSPAQYEKYYQAAAAKYGIPENVLKGQDYIESTFNPGARSPTGAQGISQFEPSTAKSYGVQFGTGPTQVASQIMGQAQYLKALGYDKNPSLALSKYNAGPGNPGAAGPYAANVLAAAKNYGGGSIQATQGGGGGAKQMKIPSVNAKFPGISTQAPNVFNTLAGLEQTREQIMARATGQIAPTQAQQSVSQGWQDLNNLYQSTQSQIAQGNRTLVGRMNANVKSGPRVRGIGAVSGKGDVNPLQHFTIGRTDMGVDANAPSGTPILAPNRVRSLGVLDANWYNGQPYAAFQILGGPNKGKVMYVAEQINSIPRRGAVIGQGRPIARYAPSGTGIEIGWADPRNPASTLAQSTSGYTEGQQTGAGQSFAKYLASLGA